MQVLEKPKQKRGARSCLAHPLALTDVSPKSLTSSKAISDKEPLTIGNEHGAKTEDAEYMDVDGHDTNMANEHVLVENDPGSNKDSNQPMHIDDLQHSGTD